MKTNRIYTTLLLLPIVLLWACGGDTPEPQKSAEELALEALTANSTQVWAVANGGSVRKGTQSLTDTYQNFELSISSGSSRSYTTQNNNQLFDNAGSWSFSGSNFDKLLLNGSSPAAGREISFTVNGSNLSLIFTVPAPDARLKGTQALAGNYTFNLVKK